MLVRANGIDIHYEEVGTGDPLILLHGGMVTTSATWAGSPIAFNDHIPALAEHFRVIAPDTRGGGRTAHDGDGPVPLSLLAEDVTALAEALALDRPALLGFSEGGITATLAAIQSPNAFRAVVNLAGYDVFDPENVTFGVIRTMYGGSPQAAQPDPDAAERAFSEMPDAAALFARMQADQDAGQGPGHWRRYVALIFWRYLEPPCTFDALAAITAPTLILGGDRDQSCTLENAAAAYRALGEDGSLAIMPGTDHAITAEAIRVAIDFLVG